MAEAKAKPGWWDRVGSFVKQGPAMAALWALGIGVVTAVLTCFGPSRTTEAQFGSVEPDGILLLVSNNGWRSSHLHSSLLEFPAAVMIENEPLKPDKADAAIIPRGTQTIHLEMKGLKAKTDPLRGKPYPWAQIEPELVKATAILWIDVAESSGKHRKLPIPVEGAAIRDLVRSKLPGEED